MCAASWSTKVVAPTGSADKVGYAVWLRSSAPWTATAYYIMGVPCSHDCTTTIDAPIARIETMRSSMVDVTSNAHDLSSQAAEVETSLIDAVGRY